jgi:predicted helicase
MSFLIKNVKLKLWFHARKLEYKINHMNDFQFSLNVPNHNSSSVAKLNADIIEKLVGVTSEVDKGEITWHKIIKKQHGLTKNQQSTSKIIRLCTMRENFIKKTSFLSKMKL